MTKRYWMLIRNMYFQRADRFLSNDTYEEHFIHLNSGYRTPKQALVSVLQVVAGLDPNSQDECFEAVVSALREASNEGFLHVIERLQKGNMFCKT